MFGGVIYNHYLCIDNVREMSGWGNNTSWSVDSNLLYKIYKGPHLLVKEKICLCQILCLSLWYDYYTIFDIPSDHLVCSQTS